MITKPIEFWIAIAVAVLVKVKTCNQLSWLQVIATILVAIGAAYALADFVAEFLTISDVMAAALVALTAEGVMRWILKILEDPTEIIRLLKEWKR